jgi:hypothetical protein
MEWLIPSAGSVAHSEIPSGKRPGAITVFRSMVYVWFPSQAIP